MKNTIIPNIKANWKSGLTVALINIPLSISIAVASGASPLQGLLTGIWGGIFAAIFASSKHNIYGVAGALTSILLSFATLYGAQYLPFLAILSGLIIIIIALLKITKYITLLPSTVLHGFLISVGISIALGQISAAVGLNDPILNIPTHKEIYMTLIEVIKNITKINIAALLTFAVGFGFLLFTKKKYPKFPGVIVLTGIGVIIGVLVKFGYYPKLYLLMDKFTNLQFNLFDFSYFGFGGESKSNFSNIIKPLITTSFVIAIIAILETIISAKIAQGITKVKFNKDKEVFGLGMSNLFSGLAGGLPSTAVFIRTALNIKSGATSKYSALLTGVLTLFMSAVLLTGVLKYLPFPIIAAILINIAVGLIDINLLKKLYNLEKRAFYITLVVTFVSVFEEPTYGIIIGAAISLLIFLKGVTNGSIKLSVFRNKDFFDKLGIRKYLQVQEEGDILLMKFVGGINYLNIESMIERVEMLDKKQTVIVSFSHMGHLDLDGFEALEHMTEHMLHNGLDVYFSGIGDNILITVEKLSVYKTLLNNGKIISSTSLALKLLLGRDNIGF